MDTPPDSSWNNLVRKAAAEPPPEIDVRLSIRNRIEAERKRPLIPAAPGILDEIAALTRGRWGISALGAVSAVALLLGWQLVPALHEVAFALQLHEQLSAGL